MIRDKEGATWRWLSLVAVACLLAAGILLLGGLVARAAPEAVAAQEEPAATRPVRSSGALPPEIAELIGRQDGPRAVEADVDVEAGTWWMGGDFARPGGVAVYGVFYQNRPGSALPAEGVLLTSTLPAGTSFADDTSGLPLTLNASGVFTWDIGTLDPGQHGIFMLTVNVPSDQPTGEGTLGDRCVGILTTTPGDPDPGNDGGCSGPANVGLSDVDLGVSKGPEPQDPTPGEAFDYVIGWCNHQPSAAGPVLLTDTLPPGVIFEGWEVWPEFLQVWNEVYGGDDQLVLYAPGLPGGWCAEIGVRLTLAPDVPLGTVLENEVEVTIAEDVNLNDNWHINGDAQAGPPRPDLFVYKETGGGVLTPGGRVGYRLDFGNQGNVMVGARLTDTLPPGFSYATGSAQLDQAPFVDPVVLPTGELVWDLGPLQVNEAHTLQFDAQIGAGVADNAAHENCAVIGLDAEDSEPGDNESCALVWVWPSGPNLHVEKVGAWEGEAIYYEIFVANYGDVHLYNVHLTDTYPVGTASMPGVHEPELPGHLVVTATSNYTDNQWLFEIQSFGPGEGAWISFPASVDDPDLRPALYTNTVEIESFPGEVHADDNYDEHVIALPEVEEVHVWLEPDDNAGVWGQAPPGAQVTVTTPVAEFYTTVGNPECPSCWDVGDVGILPPGSRITVTALGEVWPVVVEIPDPFTAEVDLVANTVSGQIDHLDTYPVQVRGWWEGGWQQVTTDGAGNYEAVYDWIPPGAEGVVFYVQNPDPTFVTLRRHFQSLDLILQVNYDHDWVEGPYEPGHTVWITVTESDGETVKATAEMQTQEIPWWGGGTGFTSNLGEPWVPEPPDLQPGDWVHGRVDNGYTATVKIGEITGVIDADNDSIEGSVYADWLGVSEVPVECHPQGGPPEAPNKWSSADPSDGEPSYFCQWNPETEWDVRNGQQIAVSYYEPAGHQVYGVFEGPWTRVNYAQDWVGVDYPAGHTFVVTVTGSAGVFTLGVAEFETTPWGGWNGAGYQTNEEDWLTLPPDIEVLDWVHFASDDGYRHSVQVGSIGVDVSAAADLAYGRLDVPPWIGLVDLLEIECHPWGAPGWAPVKYTQAAPEPNSPYSCEWDPATEWDILPGQDVAAMYIEPDDGDRIINVGAQPAPDLQVEKWVEGSGEVQYDGLSLWGIRIQNQGDGPAPTVVLTDVLPADTSYLLDSSGVAPVPIPDGWVWTFDAEPLLPGDEIRFHLLLQNNLPGPDVDLVNEVFVWAEFDSNPDNNQSGAGVWATDLGPGMLHIGKDPNPGDPAPGSTFVYQINYGNHEPATTGPVVLTDTLPGGTSLVGWYSQNGYDLWEDLSTPDQLILAAPALPGHWNDTIVLRLRVDPALEPGTQLTNTAEIEWPDGYDWTVRDDVRVGEPRWDVGVHKDFGWGVLVPGGEVEYNFQIRNQGNMTATIVVTDHVPHPLASYVPQAWCHDGQQAFDCPPPTIMPPQAYWEFADVPPGRTIDMNVRWQISHAPHAEPGMEFGNCVEVGATGQEDSGPGDNYDCAETQAIREWGPNLRVRKEHNWQQDGEVLRYGLYVENIGSQRLDNVLITDIYPEGTAFNDNWWVDHGPWITLTHDAPSRELVFWADWLEPGETAGIAFDVNLVDPDLRPAWYTNTLEAPVDGDVWPDDNFWQDVAVKTEVDRVELWVNHAPEPSSMWGNAVPGEPITVTTPYSTVSTIVGQPECDDCWQIDNVGPLMPGDLVIVEAAAGLLPVELVVPDPFDVAVDTAADQVSGQIDHLDTYPVEVHGGWENGYQEVETDSNGNFLAQYDDIPRGASGYVRFIDEVSYAEIVWHRPFRAMDLLLEVNYGHDWVQGYYEPGHTVWITVTESDGTTVKATAELLSQVVPEWGDFAGFSTDLDDPWDPGRPDIVPGDWVYGRADTGATSEVDVGTIDGLLDITTERIAGTITAPWPPGTILDGWCGVWVENGPGQSFAVAADGGAYECDFSGEWDIQPGEDVGVGYYEPDQDQVINVFYEPSPDISVNKWVPGHGEVQHDGPSVWRIEIRNDGEAAAETVLLTDTLPADSVYAANSSGVEPAEVGDQLVWDFGRMEPGDQLDFVLVLVHSSPPDVTLRNQVDVWAEWDNNPDNNHAEAEVWATVLDPPELGVDKHPEPGDPAPGETFLYTINVGNNGPTATGPVRLMDIIPPGTSVVDWWAESDWPAWEELDRTGRLYLQTVVFPGYWGDTLHLQLQVDPAVEVGTQLTNTARIISPESSSVYTNTDAVVGEPRWDGGVYKDFAWGVMVPGGEVSYNVHVRNQGNMAAGFTMTDTLPEGTSLVEAWLWDGREGFEVVPDTPEPGVLVFDLGELKPAEFRDVNLLLQIDPAVVPGAWLENCAEINLAGPGDWPEDNGDCAVEMVHPEGPNVRIEKSYQWNGDGQLQFYLNFWNLGTETLEGVEIIDTLPAGTHWIEWWNDFWEGVDVRAENGQVIITLSRLEPGWASGVGLYVGLDAPGVEGQSYTNTVSVAVEGDVFPEDNYDEVTAYTGPDLFVDKWLAGGEPTPGAVLTYTIEFGNDNVWPWDSDDLGEGQPSTLLVDLLPEGMTFLTATAPWNPDDHWMPAINGQELTWEWGPMGAENYWTFDLVAQVSEAAEFGDVLTNTLEVLSLSQGDVDPLPDNNVSRVVLDVLAPSLTIGKEVNTSRVAGTMATYTLTVENVGNVPATGVGFAETLPDDLTYDDGDGVWDGTDITWNAGELAPFGGSASGWFRATLTCESGVRIVNATYGASSNEGVTATGATVAFTTLAPTIELSLASAPDPGIVDETVTLTVTALTDGTDLSYEWDLGDGPVSGGLVETNAWDAAGDYTVVVTATDACGYSEVVTRTVTIEEGTFYIHLPLVLRNH